MLPFDWWSRTCCSMYKVNIAWDRDDSSFICVAPVCRTVEPFFSKLTTSVTESHRCSLAPITTKLTFRTTKIMKNFLSLPLTRISNGIIANIQRSIGHIKKINDVVFVNFQVRCWYIDLNIWMILKCKQLEHSTIFQLHHSTDVKCLKDCVHCTRHYSIVLFSNGEHVPTGHSKSFTWSLKWEQSESECRLPFFFLYFVPFARMSE